MNTHTGAGDKHNLPVGSPANNLTQLKNIDDEDDDENDGDAVEFYFEEGLPVEEGSNLDKKKTGSAASFDEKDELLGENVSETVVKKENAQKTFARSLSTSSNTTSNTTTNNKTGKSQFYFPKSEQKESTSTQQAASGDLASGITLLPKHVYKEKYLHGLHNVTCVYTSSRLNTDSLKPDNVYVVGKLLLTNFKLIFMPYQDKGEDRLFTVDSRLELFGHAKNSPLEVVIPLSFIYEVRACEYRSYDL